MGVFKIKESDWNAFLPSQFKYSTLNSICTTLLNINSSILSISDRIDQVDRINGINYTNQANKITEAVNHMSSIESYVNQSIGDVEDLLDDEFFNQLNNEKGALERLQLATDKKYTTKNTLGIKEKTVYNEYSTSTSNAYMSGKVDGTGFRMTEKESIGFEDIFAMSNKNSNYKFKGFSDLLKEQYGEFKKQVKKENKANTISFDEYMNSILNAGKFDHSVDKGWKNWASTALDAIGIVSLVSKFTGNDFVTGEMYTEGEKEAASLNIVFSILGFATLGIGKGVQIGGKAVVIYVAGEMAASVTIKGASGVFDEMGAPKWLQQVGALVTGIVISNKIQGIMNTGVKSLDDIVEVGIENIESIRMLGIENIEELIEAGVRNVEDLIKVGVKSMDDLAKLGVTNLEELGKVGIHNGEDLAKLGIKNADEVFDTIKGASGAKSWYKKDGSINYPPNNGAVVGTEKTINLKPGDTLGRYGNIGEKSNFVTQTGADASKLSLPPTTDPKIYQEFVVVKEIPQTIQAKIAAWGDSVGGGLQYELPMPIQKLIREGYIVPK